MKTLHLPCWFAHLSTTVFMRNASHWIASLTTRKKRPTLIFSLPFAKNTTPNAVETPNESGSGPLSRLSPRRENQMVGIDRPQVATLRPGENQVAPPINSNPTKTGLGFRGQNEQNYQNRITSFSLKPFCRFC